MAITLRLHHFMPEASPVHQHILLPWASLLERASDGELRLDVVPEMRLGGGSAELLPQLEHGLVDLVWAMPCHTPQRFPRLQAMELPFVMRGRTASSLAALDFAQGHAGTELAGLQPLSVHVIGAGGFHMRRVPVRRREDLQGLRLRAPTEQAARLVRALGATPVRIEPLRTREALAGGEVDGVLMNWDFCNSTRSWEVARLHSETDAAERGLFTCLILLAMHPRRLERLPAAVRDVLLQHSGSWLAQWIGRRFEAVDGRGREAALGAGNARYLIDAAELQRWWPAADHVAREWAAALPPGSDGLDLLAQARALVDRHEERLGAQGVTT
jgi:TRAP-type transport system periplasmic protein